MWPAITCRGQHIRKPYILFILVCPKLKVIEELQIPPQRPLKIPFCFLLSPPACLLFPFPLIVKYNKAGINSLREVPRKNSGSLSCKWQQNKAAPVVLAASPACSFTSLSNYQFSKQFINSTFNYGSFTPVTINSCTSCLAVRSK